LGTRVWRNLGENEENRKVAGGMRTTKEQKKIGSMVVMAMVGKFLEVR
jgi:hypothetical protein